MILSGHCGSARAGHGRARHRRADLVPGAGATGRPASRPRSPGADLWPMGDTATQANDRTFALWRLLQLRVPSGQITAARRALSRLAGAPVTGISAARWEIMLHLSGFPDSVAARRATRVLLPAQGRRTISGSGRSLSRKVDGTSRGCAPNSRAAGPGPRHGGSPPTQRIRRTRRIRSGPGSLAELVQGDRNQLAEIRIGPGRLPALLPLAPTLLDHKRPQQYLHYRVGEQLSEQGRTCAQSGSSGAPAVRLLLHQPASCSSAGSPKPGGRQKKAVARSGRFVRWSRHAASRCAHSGSRLAKR